MQRVLRWLWLSGTARGLYLTTTECVAVGCSICEAVCGFLILLPQAGRSDYIGR